MEKFRKPNKPTYFYSVSWVLRISTNNSVIASVLRGSIYMLQMKKKFILWQCKRIWTTSHFAKSKYFCNFTSHVLFLIWSVEYLLVVYLLKSRLALMGSLVVDDKIMSEENQNDEHNGRLWSCSFRCGCIVSLRIGPIRATFRPFFRLRHYVAWVAHSEQHGPMSKESHVMSDCFLRNAIEYLNQLTCPSLH